MNCIDNACKYCKQCYLDDVIWCTLTDTVVPDNIDETQCENFVQSKTCLDCKHAKREIYETGSIDGIGYRCPFQNNKLIYDDSNVYSTHYADIPECNIGRFELNE